MTLITMLTLYHLLFSLMVNLLIVLSLLFAGKQGGKTVKLLVHHSRNNAQKQWDETIVLSFSGLSRLIKTFFSTLSQLQSFADLWSQWLKLADSLSSCCSKEVYFPRPPPPPL
jgi:hypothetical protein